VLAELENKLVSKLSAFFAGDAPGKADLDALQAIADKSTTGYPLLTGWAGVVTQFAPAIRQGWA
jgi:hypothetical protein